MLKFSLNIAIKVRRFHLSQPYFYNHIRLAVPPGEPYTSYEKLLQPFDETSWLLIVLTFIGAFSTIFFFKFLNKTVRNFVFGRNVATPSLNVVAIFCGIPQKVVPGRNFARFILMMFILYSLIIRTAWQSKMFEFLQKDMRKPEPIKSFEDAIEKNYIFYVNHAFLTLFNGTDLMRAKLANLSVLDDWKIIFDHSFQGVFELYFHDLRDVYFFNNVKILKRFLPESLSVEKLCMALPQFHRFTTFWTKRFINYLSAEPTFKITIGV